MSGVSGFIYWEEAQPNEDETRNTELCAQQNNSVSPQLSATGIVIKPLYIRNLQDLPCVNMYIINSYTFPQYMQGYLQNGFISTFVTRYTIGYCYFTILFH